MRIETDRLVLREYLPSGWEAVLAYHRDSRYLRYYPWTDCTKAQAQQFVQTFVEEQEVQPRRRFQLAITMPDDGPLIGSCGVRRKVENDWEADIGYELAPEYWGLGYATEAARAMVDFGFRDLALSRISSWCIADNTASSRVLERLDLRLEGRLRQNEYFKHRWWDTLLYGLLRDEWANSAGSQ